MAEQDKELRGSSLIGELLIRLARRAGVPVKVAELEERTGPSGIDALLDDFEKILDRRHRESRPAEPAPGIPRVTVSPSPADPKQPAAPPPPAAPPSPVVAPPAVAPSPPAAAPPPVVSPPPVIPAPVATPPRAVEEISRKQRPDLKIPVPAKSEGKKPAAPAKEAVGPPPVPSKPAAAGKPEHPRTKHTIEADDIFYFHALGQIPLDEKAAVEPFTLEEKGIEEKQFAFALDRGGVRFYLSTITGREMNVSKAGVLLLGKAESIRLRGVHYAILNDLRAHGVLLPFTFGTVAMGRDVLFSRIDDTLYDLRDALEEIQSTKWWNLGVYALDGRMAQAVGADAGSSSLREREMRVQGTRMPVAGRLDIKTLERLLGRQKKIAESVHEELKEFAVRSDVDLIVGLNSGSSNDWKPILRASYEVPPSAVEQFNRAVIDLQYHHFQYDLMFVLNGDREEFSFS